MMFTDIDIENITDKMINDILFSLPESEYIEADYLIIFGSHLKNLLDERIEKAVFLLKSKKVNKVLLTGGIGVNGNFNESEYMKEKLISLGILEDDILVENKSITTEENIINCIEILKEEGTLENSRLILVSNEAHLRRIGMELKKQLKGISVEWFYEYPDSSVISFDNVLKSEKLREMAVSEIKKIIRFIDMGIIDDENILLID